MSTKTAAARAKIFAPEREHAPSRRRRVIIAAPADTSKGELS